MYLCRLLCALCFCHVLVYGRNFSALLQWLEADLHVRIHANVTVLPWAEPGSAPTGLALSASAAPLRPRDVVISGYPLSAFLTADVAVRHARELGGSLRGVVGECLTLALFVARERLRLWRWRQHASLSRRTANTTKWSRFWDPYIESLPPEIPHGRHADGFGATLRLLRRSPSAATWLVDDAVAQQEIDQLMERDNVASMLRSWWAAGAAGGESLGLGSNHDVALLQAKAAVRWAQRIVESRALPPPSWPRPATSCALAPLLDLMNHRTGVPRLVSKQLSPQPALHSDQQPNQQPDEQQRWDMLSGSTILPGGQILDDYDATAGISGPARMCNLALLMQHGFVEADRHERFAYYHRWECAAGDEGSRGGESSGGNRHVKFDLRQLKLAALARADLPSTVLLALRVQAAHGEPNGDQALSAEVDEARLRRLLGAKVLRAMRICELRADELRRALRGETISLGIARDKNWRCALHARLSRARKRLQTLLQATASRAGASGAQFRFGGEEVTAEQPDQQPPWLSRPACRESSEGDAAAAVAIFAGELRALESALSTLRCAAP